MTQSLTHSFSLNAAPMMAAVEELSLLAERSEKVRDALVGLIEAGKQLITLENDLGTAPVAGVTIIRANPSDCLGRFLTAARAGDFNAVVVENVLSHNPVSVGCLDPSNEERALTESQGLVGACPPKSQGE